MEDKKLECIHYINSLNLPLHIISWIPYTLENSVQFENLISLAIKVIDFDTILYYKNERLDFVKYLEEIGVLNR